MIKPSDPRQLAIDLLPRSICSVQVAAVLTDNRGIFAWGWNSAGNGFGEHAEAAAIRRANKDRIEISNLFVAAQRKRNRKIVCAKPCEECMKKIANNMIFRVWYRDADERWKRL